VCLKATSSDLYCSYFTLLILKASLGNTAFYLTSMLTTLSCFSHRLPSQIKQLQKITLDCIADNNGWMKSNQLELNPAKTEFLWCASRRRLHQIDDSPLLVDDAVINPAVVVRNLGVQMDRVLSLTSHISRLVGACFRSLRPIKVIRRSLTPAATKTLINSFVASRLDYCNILFAGLPASSLDRLQSVLKAAARIIYGLGSRDHISTIMRDELHWLPVPQRVQYKLCLTAYNVLHGSHRRIQLTSVCSWRRWKAGGGFAVLPPATSSSPRLGLTSERGRLRWHRTDCLEQSAILHHFDPQRQLFQTSSQKTPS
jgi:hypothetical protein